MKIWIHRYELKPRENKIKARQGALIKTEWAIGQVGYSDLHPWPEFGEPPLEHHLESLRSLNFSPLVDRSMEFNYQDREFRIVKRNAFLGLIIPRSHRLVFDFDMLEDEHLQKWFKDGFTHVKVKMGRDLLSETQKFINLAHSTPMLWRVDFNGRVSESEFTQWWDELDPSIKPRIDFVEDPLKSGELKSDGPWANDWMAQERARIRIVKPAREHVVPVDLNLYERVVFTHSLDHIFGQACSAWAAAKYYMRFPKRLETCGLANSDFFAPDAFTQEWNCEGPRMKPTPGTGFGFDKLLASLQWDRLL